MITINGHSIELKSSITIAEYLAQNDYKADRIAVELNEAILPKDSYASTILKDGDVLEIVNRSEERRVGKECRL